MLKLVVLMLMLLVVLVLLLRHTLRASVTHRAAAVQALLSMTAAVYRGFLPVAVATAAAFHSIMMQRFAAMVNQSYFCTNATLFVAAAVTMRRMIRAAAISTHIVASCAAMMLMMGSI